MELTKEEAVKLHREMWNWIANEIKSNQKVLPVGHLKETFIKEQGFRDVTHDCFCCEYVLQERYGCSACPLDWDSTANGYMCEDKESTCDGKGYFYQCYFADSWQKQYELALKIANLEER